MRLPLSDNANATLVSVYAPTMTNQDEYKEAVHQQLDEVIRSVPVGDKLIILGGFNARIGSNSTAWAGIIGQHDIMRTQMAKFCFQYAPSTICQSQTHSSNWTMLTKPPGCTQDRSTGTKQILSSAENMTCVTFISPEQWQVLNVQHTIFSSDQSEPPSPKKEKAPVQETSPQTGFLENI